MDINPHLTFDGRCEEAFRFYERVLGAQVSYFLKYGDSPMAGDVPPEWRSKIVHASLNLGERTLAGADVLPEQYQAPQGFYVLVAPDDSTQAERIFSALAEGGSVRMKLQKTFWSPAFGVVIDRFGIPWEVSCPQAKGVKPVPDGYRAITPYLAVHDVPKLIEFLTRAFDAEVVHLHPPNNTNAELRIRDSMVLLGEKPPDQDPFPAMLYLYVTDVDAAYRQAIEAGGRSIKEPSDEYYGDRNAGIVDPSGNQWWLATRKENLSDEEIQRRVAQRQK
jgi:PhnB protein